MSFLSTYLEINYTSEEFSVTGPVANGVGTLETCWNDLIWAALTIGRPNLAHVFSHGDSSRYEAIFRLSLMRMSLEQKWRFPANLCRTKAVKSLDPSEKGAVNYFIGMTMCKLFATKLLDTPWLLHLDVFRRSLDVTLQQRSRPDLVGQSADLTKWIAMESKGRSSPPSEDAKEKAKLQAQRVTHINGSPPAYQLGCITYYRDDIVEFFWRDPQPQNGESGGVKVQVEDRMWGYYYAPVLSLIQSPEVRQSELPIGLPLFHVDDGLDIHVGIEPVIHKFLLQSQWGDARKYCAENSKELNEAGYQADGIRIVAGSSWLSPFKSPTI